MKGGDWIGLNIDTARTSIKVIVLYILHDYGTILVLF
jgi:hypothetical protein